ncbi:YecA family protein [Paenibacillus silvisoli]|uniref:YecA family protein n=1 Tax=Paenibacillus silvisoli TaxID=3110539 RepID=UPI002806253D|nr:SEC-C metal-binding domain-containing protein [Paenibacillus silvisoli]
MSLELEKEIRQLNAANAIKGAAATSLKEILPMLTKDRLNFIAAGCSLTGRSKLKKQELADALFERITDEQDVRKAFLTAETEEWAFVSRLLEAPYVQDDDVFPSVYLFLMDKGLLFSFMEQDKLYYVIPEEIKSVYRNLDQQAFHQERSYSQLVLQYIEAVVSLYGICPIEKMLEIYNDQNEGSLTKEAVDAVCASVAEKDRTWEAKDGYLFSDELNGESVDEFAQFLETVKDKPYYVPAKEELLLYANIDYFEMTPQLEALKQYIVQSLGKVEQLADAIVDDVQLACSMEESPDAVLNEFERRGIRLSQKQLKELKPLLFHVYSHTRTWANRGYTPAELNPQPQPQQPQAQPKSAAAPSNVVPFQAPSAKIGRNEPCPCGSGKKFKKCCL